MTRQTKAQRTKAVRAAAVIALRGYYHDRAGRMPYEVFKAARTTCDRLAVDYLLKGDVPRARKWAHASTLLNERLVRALR